MRRSYNDYGFVKDENEQVIGFCLGYDFCAEHEFGATAIKNSLNIEENPLPVGLKGRKSRGPITKLIFEEYTDSQITRLSSGKRKTDKVPAAFLVCAKSWELDHIAEQKVGGLSGAKIIQSMGAQLYEAQSSLGYNPERDDIAVSWSGNSGFAINVRGEDNIRMLKELHQAMLDGDICMTPPTASGFLRKSAALGIYSRISDEIKKDVINSDMERDRILKKVKDSGIEKRLKAAGKKWYALSPDEQKDGSLQFYLNPEDQKNNDFGWFTIEELDQWIKGEGPVVTGRQAKELMKEFSDSINGLDSAILTKINENGHDLYRIKAMMLNDIPCMKIESNHPTLNGVKTLDEIKEILQSQRKMKP